MHSSLDNSASPRKAGEVFNTVPSDSGKRVVLAALLERQGRFLICQRPSHKHHGGLWEFPGGKLEPGETLLQAAQRELKEELGLNVSKIGSIKFSVSEPGSQFEITFVEVEAEGEPILLEHSALNWLLPEQLLSLELAPADRLCVEHLTKYEGESRQ